MNEKRKAPITVLKEQNVELESKNQSLAEENERLKKAINTPVIISKTIEPMEMQIGQDHVVTGRDDTPELIIPKAESVEDPAFAEKMANLDFMREPITVKIHETSEKNAQRIFEVSVNGQPVIFKRGEVKTVPRYIVETLARAKPTGYRNEEFTTDEGIRSVRWPSETGLRFPFSVVKDSNPLGESWLQSVLAQP